MIKEDLRACAKDSVHTFGQVAESLSPSTWQTLRLRDGAKGPWRFSSPP